MTTEHKPRRGPKAFRPDDPNVTVETTMAAPDAPVTVPDTAPALPPAQSTAGLRRGVRWGTLLLLSLGGLISLTAGLWLSSLVQDLMARQDWIGWLAIGLLGFAGFAALMVVLKEAWGLARLARLGRTRQNAESALNHGEKRRALGAVRDLKRLYAQREDLAWARGALRRARGRHHGRPRDADAGRARAGGAPRPPSPRHRGSLGQAHLGADRGQPGGADRHGLRGRGEPAHAAPAGDPLRRAAGHARALAAGPHGRRPYRAHRRHRHRRRPDPADDRPWPHRQALGPARGRRLQRGADGSHRHRRHRRLPAPALHRGGAPAPARPGREHRRLRREGPSLSAVRDWASGRWNR